MAQRLTRIQQSLKAAAEAGDIKGLYDSIKEDPNVLDRIDAIPFVDTPLHTAASAGQIDFAIEILRLKPSFGKKLNPDGLSSLHLAVSNDEFNLVRRLIKLDKELIRVKGKQGNTPLHFIAANQQQRALDDDRVDILAEFLFACPDSIEDLTNQDESPLHIAVKTGNKSAVQVILGFISRINKKRVLTDKDDKGNTALDVALLRPQTDEARSIVKSLRGAGGALKSSSRADCSLAQFLNSPQRHFELLYKYMFFWGGVSMELRNIGLVVAVLIATASFQAVLSPPGGVDGGGNNLLTDGGYVNATVSSTNNNLFAGNTSFINATLFIPTDNPAKPLLFKDDPATGKYYTYTYLFLSFFLWNTCAFFFSIATIMFVLPLKLYFLLLHGSLFCLIYGYLDAFVLISPSVAYAEGIYLGKSSFLLGLLVYACRVATSLTMKKHLRTKRLMMLKRLLGNIN